MTNGEKEKQQLRAKECINGLCNEGNPTPHTCLEREQENILLARWYPMPERGKPHICQDHSCFWDLTRSNGSLQTWVAPLWDSVTWWDGEEDQLLTSECNSSRAPVFWLLVFRFSPLQSVSFGKEFPGTTPYWVFGLCGLQLLAD